MTNAIQISAKRNTGEIYVVGGATFDEFYSNLIGVLGEDVDSATVVLAEMQDELKGLNRPVQVTPAEAVANVSRAFPSSEVEQDSWDNARPASPTRPAPRAPAPRAAAGPRPGGPAPARQAPTCAHGWEMEWKEGVGKYSGKAYAFWACASTDRNDQCPKKFR